MNSSMLLSFSFYMLKRAAEKNSDAYKQIAGENSSAIIKDSMLIDSGLPVNFLIEAMDITNYLHNCLPSKPDGPIIIPKEA